MKLSVIRVCVPVAIAGVVVAGGPAVLAAADPGPPPHVGYLKDEGWGPCGGEPEGSKEFAVVCKTITVPQDWTKPARKKFSLALKRVHKLTDPDDITSPENSAKKPALVFNLGGPGEAGYASAAKFAKNDLSGLVQKFDVVGFDPRGVGSSSPVSCLLPKEQDDIIAKDGEGYSDSISTACQKKYDGTKKPHLNRYSTKEAARDLDAIRAAVGDEKLTYLGWSYGTRLGASYAHQFPDKVRAMVLDGPDLPKSNDGKWTNQPENETFDKNLQEFGKQYPRALTLLAAVKKTAGSHPVQRRPLLPCGHERPLQELSTSPFSLRCTTKTTGQI